MPGPLPKTPALRQRRNKTSTRALLLPETAPILRAPRLPAHPIPEEQWHGMTIRWWRDVWSSPLRQEFIRADLGALFRLAVMVDMYWKTGKIAVATEIRLLEREFGLTPMARRRLEWTVAQTEEAKDRHEHKRARRAVIIDGDPREVLE